ELVGGPRAPKAREGGGLHQTSRLETLCGARPMRQTSPAARPLLLLALAPSSCGKTMTAGDCERVGKHMRAVWDAETSATAPEGDAPVAERAKLVIKGEGDRMEAEWNADCRRELEGR